MSESFYLKLATLLRPNKCEGGPSTTMKNKPSLYIYDPVQISEFDEREKNLGESANQWEKILDFSTVYSKLNYKLGGGGGLGLVHLTGKSGLPSYN